MITALLLLAAALLVWPGRRSAWRLSALAGIRSRKWNLPKPNAVSVTIAGAVGGWVMLGIGGGIAGAGGAIVAWRRWNARQDVRRRVSTVADLAETLRSLVGELRAGAHPAIAAESVATDAPPSGADAMRKLAVASRTGGDVEQVVKEPLLAETVHAWALAQQHGLPLADVLDAVVRDLEQRARFAGQVQARMAGPRASAAILAALPILGIALGEAMGAHPLHVLSSTTFGQILLVVGIGLVCTGIQWSARLTQQAVLP